LYNRLTTLEVIGKIKIMNINFQNSKSDIEFILNI